MRQCQGRSAWLPALDLVLRPPTIGEYGASRMWHSGRLGERQGERVAEWLGDDVLIRDLSWHLVDTAVLHVSAAAGEFIVKAGGPSNHHIGRTSRRAGSGDSRSHAR